MTSPTSSNARGWRRQLQRTLIYFGLAEDQSERPEVVRQDESWFLILFLPVAMAAWVGSHRDATAGWVVVAAFLPTTLLSVAISLRVVSVGFRDLANALAIPALMVASTLGLAPQHTRWPTILAIAAAITAAAYAMHFTMRPSRGTRRK